MRDATSHTGVTRAHGLPETEMEPSPQKIAAPRRARRPGRPTMAEAEHKSAELLEIAAEVFLENGYRNTKISDIIARLGGSKGTLYARYATKGELFGAVIEHQIEQVEQVFSRQLSDGAGLVEVMTAFGHTLFATMYDPRMGSLFRILVEEAAEFPELALKLLRSGPMRATFLLKSYLESQPEFDATRAEIAADSFCSLCLGLPVINSLLNPTDRPSPAEVARKVAIAVDTILAAHCPEQRRPDGPLPA